MKALFCAKCHDLHSPNPDGSWTFCRCEQSAMRWVDAFRGIANVKALDRSMVRVIGIDNAFLQFAFQDSRHSDTEWRDFHSLETNRAAGFLFHTSRRNCGMVIFQVGETNDVSWEEWQ